MKKARRRSPVLARSAAVADINITPMVDVLLCLLIFVMVIQPGLLKGLDVQVPVPEVAGAGASMARDQIVLHVYPGPAYALNGTDLPAGQLEVRLRELFRNRARKVLFVDGAEDAVYADVIGAVDMARGAGVRVVGLVPREVATRSKPPAP
jgi:biopolymer transport protein ExbD